MASISTLNKIIPRRSSRGNRKVLATVSNSNKITRILKGKKKLQISSLIVQILSSEKHHDYSYHQWAQHRML